VQVIRDFFTEIDRLWPQPEVHGRKVRLSIIGSGALMLQASYERGTKDSDVFETTDLTDEVKRRLVALAGSGSALHRRRNLYLDIVANGVPFLPHVPIWHPVLELNGALEHLDLAVLDVVDVVVSKLKRFNANDQSDIDAMIVRELVPHERLIDRFRAAVDELIGDARAPDLPKYVANLHRVERDMLLVPETEIELPSWI
jgi:uncharacterized nucleotidyltransferase DUF6036